MPISLIRTTKTIPTFISKVNSWPHLIQQVTSTIDEEQIQIAFVENFLPDKWPGFLQNFNVYFNDSNYSNVTSENLENWPENNGPTNIILQNEINSLPENTDTTNDIMLADIAIQDDQYGTNYIFLSGIDKEFFIVKNSQLYLKKDSQLNFETKSSYDITINCIDTSSRDSSITTQYILNIEDILE